MTYDISALVNDKAERLRQARERAGYRSAANAARALGVSYPTYVAHENPNAPTSFRADSAERYARKFKVNLEWLLTGRGELTGDTVAPLQMDVVGLPILGNIQAGHWLETTFVESDGEPELLPAARDPRFPRARQYALRVIGDSMDLDYPDGSHVTCVDYAESGLSIKEGLTVHVERHQAGGQLVEITLKNVARRRGKWVLIPRSSNPIHQPITFSGHEHEVVIRGVVTGGWARKAIPT